MLCAVFFFFKQKTAYEMRISDWSSDVCSSDLHRRRPRAPQLEELRREPARAARPPHRRRRDAAGGRRLPRLLHAPGRQPVHQFRRDGPVGGYPAAGEIGRAHVCPVTNAQLVCRLLPEKTKAYTSLNTQQITRTPY